MTADTTTAPEVGQPRQPLAEDPETPVTKSLEAERDRASVKRHSMRRVALHGGTVSAVGGAATLAHVAGAGVAGGVVGGLALVASGAVAYRKRDKSARRARSRPTTGGRARTAVTRTLTRRAAAAQRAARTANGRGPLARRRAGQGATAASRRATTGRGVASSRQSRRNAGPGAGASSARRFVRRATGRSLGARNGRRHGGVSGPATITGRTARTTRRARLVRGATARPTGNSATRSARVSARRQIAQGARRGYAKAKRYTRFTDPAATAKNATAKKTAAATASKKTPAMRAAAQKKTPAKKSTAQKNAAKKTPPNTTTRPAAKTAPPVAASATRPVAKPGRPLAAPGRTPKASTPMTTVGTQALTEAIQEHIGGFQPTHALHVETFILGLAETFSELAASLSVAGQRIGSEHPIDARVADHIEQMAGHASTLSDWASEGHRLFRTVHEVEIERHENPRVAEQEWDVTTRD